MKIRILIPFYFCLITNVLNAQNINIEKISFDIQENAENLSGSSDKILGLKLSFEINNKDLKIGKGRGWLVYKDGALVLDSITKILYPNEKLIGFIFINDLFQYSRIMFNNDTLTLNDFDVYFFSVDPIYLEQKLNTDGEGAGTTFSFYEKYPCIIKLYKKPAGLKYYQVISKYNVSDENEYLKITSDISNFRKSTYSNSNIKH